MSQRIIVLCGLRGVGKDTVAAMISEAGCGTYVNLKFAGPLKRAMQDVFGLTRAEVEDPSAKDVPMPRWGNVTPRTLMQWFGTDVMQHELATIAPNAVFGQRMFWAEQMRRQIQSCPTSHVVISDARFPHEVEMLRSSFRNVLVVRITRDRIDTPPSNSSDSSIASDSDNAVDAHESELGVNGIRCDMEICNDGSLACLRDAVHRVIIENVRSTCEC
jgi:hypothetical protein